MFRPHCYPGRSGTKTRPSPVLAFTLVELLTVIAIIAILVSIAFGVARGVKHRAAVQQTRADLAVLAQSIENHLRRSDDYPHNGELKWNRSDPWGQSYNYYYFSANDRLGYVLYSAGPDGLHEPPTSLTDRHETDPKNLDNLYAEN